MDLDFKDTVKLLLKMAEEDLSKSYNRDIILNVGGVKLTPQMFGHDHTQ